MPTRTQLFQQLPWIGGLNTSIDESMIPPNQLTAADHVIFDTRGSRKKRDGINFNWDTNASGSNSIIGLHDFWFGSSGTRTQRLIGVTSDRKIYSYNGSTATQLTDSGTAWSGTLTKCSMLTFGNKVFIAVDGSSNVVKCWDGSSSSVYDLFSRYNVSTVSRSSSGTTRTLIFNQASPVGVSGTIIISGMGDSHYNGTFTVVSNTTTTVTNDTITYTATGSLSESTTADTGGSVGKVAPKMSILQEHLGRIWGNDKSSLDLVNYSQTGDPFVWGGDGDSGGFPIGEGDGDPSGITSIFPTFKGDTFIAKQTKLYRMEGLAPEEFQIYKVSDGIGCVSHNSIAPIDQDDVFFVSEKGVHSLAATQQFGDFQSTFVSFDIQKTFNDLFNKSRLQYVHAAYDANANSVALTFSSLGANHNDTLYLYNIPIKGWYRWPGFSCQSLIVSNDLDKKRFYIGSNTGRIAKTFNGTNYDTDETGTHVGINFRITTGQMFLDNSPYSNKGFKRFILYYRPTGTHNLSTSVYIDNFSLNTENNLAFSLQGGIDLIGSTFIVGTSIVGVSVKLGAYTRTIDGFGKGVKLDFQQSGTDEAIEIQGFAIEYESAGTVPEVFTN